VRERERSVNDQLIAEAARLPPARRRRNHGSEEGMLSVPHCDCGKPLKPVALFGE
jgi:hypothetical protein